MDLIPSDFARAWIDAWNSQDLERFLGWYAEDVVFSSPTALRFEPDSAGTITGKPALRRYWSRALAANPDLHFELQGCYRGVDALAIHYATPQGQRVIELMLFTDGLISAGFGTHEDRRPESSERRRKEASTG